MTDFTKGALTLSGCIGIYTTVVILIDQLLG
jgi:hypothetical protein